MQWIRGVADTQRGYVAILGLLFGVAIIGMLYAAWTKSSLGTTPDGATTTTRSIQADVQLVHDAEGIKAAAEARDREYQKLIVE